MKLALAPIVAELKRAGFRQVEGVLEFAGMQAAPAQLPALFVVPTGEDGSRNTQNVGARDQRVEVAIGVVVVLDASRRRADGVAEDLKEVTDRVKGALVGWTHPEASAPFDFANGRLLSASGSTAEWIVRLTTRYHLRKAS